MVVFGFAVFSSYTEAGVGDANQFLVTGVVTRPLLLRFRCPVTSEATAVNECHIDV